MPSLHHLKIATTSPVGGATIELDGEQVQHGVRGVAVRLEVGELNQATLELVAPEVEAEGEFQIMLPEKTQDLLKRLGWTPPG